MSLFVGVWLNQFIIKNVMIRNHYNVKLLKGYGFSISVKDSKIVLKNCYDSFSKPEIEEWFVKDMQYQMIVLKGMG